MKKPSTVATRVSLLDKNGHVILIDTEGTFGLRCKVCMELLSDTQSGTKMYCSKHSSYALVS